MMTLEEAKREVEALRDRLFAEGGITIHGWDDGALILTQRDPSPLTGIREVFVKGNESALWDSQ